MYPDINSTRQAFIESKESDLIRLVYVSRPTLKGRFNKALFRDIHSKADNYNRKNGITGVLCYGGGHFFQCLEGPKQAVIDLMERIFADDNHKIIHVIYAKDTHQHLFSEWRMHCITLDKARWDKNSVQADNKVLNEFLPFEPRYWTSRTIESFLDVLKDIQAQTDVDRTTSSIAIFETGSKIGYASPPHAKFLMIQAVIAVIAVASIMTVI